jgi:hypothetical protein
VQQTTTFRVSFAFRDREGEVSNTSLSLSASRPLSEIGPWIQQVADAMAALVDSRLDRVTMTVRFLPEGPLPEPGPESDTQVWLLLYYTNGDVVEAIQLPSPKSSLFETTGEYAGIRVDATVPEMADWAPVLATTIDGMVTPEGDPFPNVFLAGGRAV